MEEFNLQEAIDTIDVEAWLDREGVEYRLQRGSRGIQANVKECPCCGNAKWKVFLNAESGLGNCFSGECEEKFNKWKFIKAHMPHASNRDVIEHIKAVAKEQGWRPPRLKSAEVNNNTELVMPASFALPYKGRNLKYLDNRGINARIASYFNLRFRVAGKFDYWDGPRHLQQDYSNRIIIPVYDLQGDLVSFQGRDITGTAERKYLFPPGFSATGTHLYNAHNAIGASRVVINEGVFDVAATKIALDEEMDLRAVVPIGSFGKHLSSGDENSQLSKLLKLKEWGLKECTFMWDGEPRAIHDAIDAALQVRQFGLTVRVAILPDGKDPNELPPAAVRFAFWRAVAITPQAAVMLKLKHKIA